MEYSNFLIFKILRYITHYLLQYGWVIFLGLLITIIFARIKPSKKWLLGSLTVLSFFAFSAVNILGSLSVNLSEGRRVKLMKLDTPSGVVGKTFTNKTPIVYIKNLPHDLNKYLNKPNKSGPISYSLISPQAEYWIEHLNTQSRWRQIRWDSPKKLSAIYLAQNTMLTVLDEYRLVFYRIFHNPQGSLFWEAHILLVEDELGNIAEVRASEFEKIVSENIPENQKRSLEEINEVAKIVEHLNHSKIALVSYCRNSNESFIFNTKGDYEFNSKITTEEVIYTFFSKFNLEDVPLRTIQNRRCELEIEFSFGNPDEFITTYFFLEHWESLEGSWQLIN